MKRAFKIPAVLEDQERAALLRKPNKRLESGIRNLSIITLMTDAGLRVSEVLNLRPADVNWISGRIHVHQGKGSQDRIVHINEDALELLRSFRERRSTRGAYLFASRNGRRLDDRYIRRMVKRYAKRAGIRKDVHPHTLRHSFATDLYRQTKNIRLVQKALGHADLSSTQIYTHILDAELETAMKTFRKTRAQEVNGRR
jgi:integrase/recombinase XerD